MNNDSLCKMLKKILLIGICLLSLIISIYALFVSIELNTCWYIYEISVKMQAILDTCRILVWAFIVYILVCIIKLFIKMNRKN